ncbi:hypothetical protein D9758_001073 [Tetrapyrgos nigripes]|uniref:Coiled-coil domain-containing protein 58 n=1 Tax=Tetrapyrgos nigripes TaxID=182062 RepID=A0A8H5LUB6_9AGAR|nr:hypothetical protein D9758_001073 [Tetrapyrgos nigripes]
MHARFEGRIKKLNICNTKEELGPEHGLDAFRQAVPPARQSPFTAAWDDEVDNDMSTIQPPQPPGGLPQASPETCVNLSLFKELLKEYRQLDDTINMRLNRANANVRDEERGRTAKGTIEDQACARLWQELVSNWNRRKQLVGYCVSIVDRGLEEKQKIIENQDTSPAARRKIVAEKYADEVKRQQFHNEVSVEMIVRKRSLEVFRSKCRYFVPPLTDVEARRMWDAALR